MAALQDNRITRILQLIDYKDIIIKSPLALQGLAHSRWVRQGGKVSITMYLNALN